MEDFPSLPNIYQQPESADAGIRRSIDHHEQSVLDLQAEIETLMQTVRNIRFRIFEHQETIRFYKGKITLARRLPAELLATIFEICTLDGWTRAPLAVSQVCTEWRIAAQAPAVWSQVYVNADSLDPVSRTRFWLTKSQSVPIDITLDVPNNSDSLSEVIQLLLSHQFKWRSFTLSARQLATANFILHQCIGVYPMLQVLRLSVDEEFHTLGNGVVDESAELRGLRNSFNHCPQLRSFIISRNIPPTGSIIPSNISSLSINLDGFSTITLSIVTLMDLLLEVPLLEKLCISLARAHNTTFLPNRNSERPNVTLQNLKVLTLMGQSDLFALLQSICTPTLLHLHLMSSAEPISASQWSGLPLLQWLERGQTSLESLELRDVDVARDMFIACFIALPSLKSLKLHDSEISDAVFDSLHGAHGYCPNLATVDLRWCGQVSGQALARFIKGKMVTSPIESITIINCSFVEEQHILDLAQNTVCRLVIDLNDHCRPVGCCENERYRRRLRLRRIGTNIDEKHRLIL
ncbi:hypothetical protein BDP27DRAFT_1314755 [Rhodocollybia butyracea]|uniref:F-box domain-containing protein n=1 Tax=Rhodocollybia butyracea TaxID=206335 RepID=A0A9P5Q7B9_9AGAR|nr:hypothetical protein BDP27DRAFT_1314755 [Rhodocollybia butyracea]